MMMSKEQVFRVLDDAIHYDNHIYGKQAAAARKKKARAAVAAVYAERDALQRRVAELEDLMRQIERRTFAHQDDDNDDRKRNLYIANSHAREALARSKGGAS